MSEQIFQISVKGLIRNENGEIFMVHLPKWNHNPDHWDLPGGRVDKGENFLQALKREINEELGVSYTTTPKQIMGMLTNFTIPLNDALIPLVYMIYSIEIPVADKLKLVKDIREDDYRWVTPKEAAKLMTIKFSPEFCKYIRNL